MGRGEPGVAAHLEGTTHPDDAGLTPKARGERTRRRIAESALALLVEREAPPTAQDIAERAGVSLRLIFHHFEDLDALHFVAGSMFAERFGHLVPTVPADLPIATRVERTVKRRAVLYEAIGNLGRNADALRPNHPGVAAGAEAVRALMVSFVEETFSAELDAAGRGRKDLLGAIETSVSWHVWDHMRRFCDLSVASSKRVMTRLLLAALDGAI